MGFTAAFPISSFWKNQDEIGVKYFSLAFPYELELSFLDDYTKKSLRPLRIGFILGIIFYGLFGLLDYLLVPDQVNIFWLIRYAFVCPFLLAIYISTFHQDFKKFMQLAVALSWIISSLGILAMIILAPPPICYSYYVGLILVFICGYTFVRARFIYAAPVGWLIVVLYEIILIISHETPPDIFLINNFFFISANVLGMATCYLMEFFARKDFYLETQLELERGKTEELNRTLEARIAESTSEIRMALNDKEVLLKEVHHRVKNNLQIISSLMQLQCRTITNTQTVAALGECKQRIFAMAMVHEDIYQSENYDEIDLYPYLKRLVRRLHSDYDSYNIKIKFNKEDIKLKLQEAIPCSLIFNELIANSMKHAFPDASRKDPRIDISITETNSIKLFVISDNGIGIPDDVNTDSTESLGLKLVNILVKDQLMGNISCTVNNGTSYRITF